MVYFMENPNPKWIRTRGSPILQETSIWGVNQPTSPDIPGVSRKYHGDQRPMDCFKGKSYAETMVLSINDVEFSVKGLLNQPSDPNI